MAGKELNLREKLVAIQTELKAPKNLYNNFGKYAYRNAEGIQEALKPLEAKYNCFTTLSDEIVEIGGRVYVKATATISNTAEIPESISVTAYAREASEKKGMDDAQVTGATSSYARKYALNGLFLLDDTKDVDSEEYQSQATPKKQTKKAPAPTAPAPTAPASFICESCGQPISNHGKASAEMVAKASRTQFGKQLCYPCAHALKEARDKAKAEETTPADLPFPMPE